MNLQRKEKGFTIIEVVLVLAIAGLIFLMVFIALPALQRNQRDTARKSDVASVASGVVSFSGNNRGTSPTTGNLVPYVSNVSDNTDKAKISVVTYSADITVRPLDTEILVTMGSVCGDAVAAVPPAEPGFGLVKGTTRQFTVVTKLESGGRAYFCQDS